MRLPLSLFVLVLFSSGAIVVNCDDSADNKNNNSDWDIFFWFAPELIPPTQEQKVTKTNPDTSAPDTENSEDKSIQPRPSNDFDSLFPPFAVLPKTRSTTVSSYAEASSSSRDDNDKDDMDQKEYFSRKEPKHTENLSKGDVVVPKTTNTATEYVKHSDCKGKDAEPEDFFFDSDMLSKLLQVLSTCDDLIDSIPTEKKKEPVANPDTKVVENVYGYSISGKDLEEPPSCKKSAVKEDIATDSSSKLPEKKTLIPSKSDTEDLIAEPDSNIVFVPLEKSRTVAKAVAHSEPIIDSVPRKELNIADEMPPKATAVEQNKQHDASDDDKKAKKSYSALSLRNLLRNFVLLGK